MTKNRVFVQALVDFADGRKKVDPFELAGAAESLYRSIKIVGISNTVVFFKDKNGKEVECRANETSAHVRAFSAYIMRQIYRWDDMNLGRLEAHYQLQAPISVILADTGVFKTNGADLACTNVAEMIDTWAIN